MTFWITRKPQGRDGGALACVLDVPLLSGSLAASLESHRLFSSRDTKTPGRAEVPRRCRHGHGVVVHGEKSHKQSSVTLSLDKVQDDPSDGLDR